MAKLTAAARKARGQHLAGLSPLQIETVASWIDQLADSALETAKTLMTYLESAPEDSSARGQLTYRRNYAQTAKHIASLLRQSAAAR